MSGHASHKSTAAKPNVNAEAKDLEPQDPQPESGYPYDADAEVEQNSAATDRVSDKPQESPEEA